jgi:hypothetical protein
LSRFKSSNGALGIEPGCVYDNSVDDRDAHLVLRATDGHIARRYCEPPAWSAPIISRLSRGDAEP